MSLLRADKIANRFNNTGPIIVGPSTVSGNFTVTGILTALGIGVTNDVFVGGGLTTKALTATNSAYLFDTTLTGFTTAGIVTGATYYGDGVNLAGVVTSVFPGPGIQLNPTSGQGRVQISANGVAVAGYSTNAGLTTDVKGGGAGQVLYQIGNNDTGFTATGNAGEILQSNGTTVPTWVSLAAINVSYADSAGISTNLRGGSAGRIPYQTGIDQTAFFGPVTSGFVILGNGSGAPDFVDPKASLNVAYANTSGVTTSLENGYISNASSMEVIGVTTLGITTAKLLNVTGITTTNILNVGTAATIPNLTLSTGPGVGVTAILDEDDMVSNRVDALVTQQSIKKYVDDQVTVQDLDGHADNGIFTVDLDSEIFGVVGTTNEIYTIGSGQTVTVGLDTNVTVPNNLTVTDSLYVSGIASVGAAITMYGNTGIISATQFHGDGSNLTNVVSTLSITNQLYVTPDGNDENDGYSYSNAKRTVGSALTVAKASTVVNITAGSYVENNPIILPEQVTLLGDSLREVSIVPKNRNNDLIYVANGSYVENMTFTGTLNEGKAIISFDPNKPSYVTQGPYIRNCTNFITNSIGMKIDGADVIGPTRAMNVDSYTQLNQGGIGVSISNEGYAQLVSIFTIYNDQSIVCVSGGQCDLTNSNSSFGRLGLVADGIGPTNFIGTVSQFTSADSNTFPIDLSTETLSIKAAEYDQVSGLTTITTNKANAYSKGMSVNLSGLGFTCPTYSHDLIVSTEDGFVNTTTTSRLTPASGTTYDPATGLLVLTVASGHGQTAQTDLTATTGTSYNPKTGVLTVTTTVAHGLATGSYIKFAPDSLTFTCATDGNGSNHTYPRSTDPIFNTWKQVSVTNTTTFTIDVGKSPDLSTHTFVTATTGGVKKANSIIGIVDGAVTFTCAKDGDISNHAYPRVSDPASNAILGVEATTTTSITINIGKSPDTSLHTFISGVSDSVIVKAQPSKFTSSIQSTYNPSSGALVVDVEAVHGLTAATGLQATTGTAYDPESGVLTVVTTGSHGLVTGNLVKFNEGAITFTCATDGNGSNHAYPRTTDPVYNKWIQITYVSSTSFKATVGASSDISVHAFVSGTVGGILKANSIINIVDDSINFSCGTDFDISYHSYPRSTDPASNAFIGVESTTSETFTLNIGKSSDTSTHNALGSIISGFTSTSMGTRYTAQAGTTYDPATGLLVLNLGGGHGLTADSDLTATTGTTYNPRTGILNVVTTGSHSLVTGDYIKIEPESLKFTCATDNNVNQYDYPRSTDPIFNTWKQVSVVNTTTFQLDIGKSSDISAHTFVSATVNGVKKGNSLISIVDGAVTFTCATDSDSTNHAYPRFTDPANGAVFGIEATATQTVTINIGKSPDTSLHTFVPASAVANGIIERVKATSFTAWGGSTYNDGTGELVIDAGTSTSALNAATSFTATTGTTYTPSTGNLRVVTTAPHGIVTGDLVKIIQGAVTFTCTSDNNKTQISYPRSTDPTFNKWLQVTQVNTTTFDVNVGSTTTGDYVHTFVSGTADGILKANSILNIVDDSIVFTCSRDNYTRQKSYPTNIDPFSNQFVGVEAVSGDTFTVNIGQGNLNAFPDNYGGIFQVIDANVTSYTADTGTAYNPSTGILTITTSTAHGLTTGDEVLIADDSLTFTCLTNPAAPKTYPRSTDPASNKFLTVTVSNSTTFTVDVGISSDTTDHTFVSAVANSISSGGNKFSTYVGISTILHTYNSGGNTSTFITTPFDGQVVYFDSIYNTIDSVTITNGGSGYTQAPQIEFSNPSESWGIKATGVARLTGDEVTSIDMISDGRGYTGTPTVTITGAATGTPNILPTYYVVSSATPIVGGISTVSFTENVPYAVGVGTTVPFVKQSRVLASSQAFEYIGSGNTFSAALPQRGGVSIPENEIVSRNGGLVIFTSTDQAGNFKIGKGVVINQLEGSITGDAYSRSLFANITPYILALGGGD